MKNAIATAILFLASGGATLAFARSARVAASNVGFRLVLALATLGFDLAFARFSRRGAGLANYTKLFFCIIRVWRFFTVLAKPGRVIFCTLAKPGRAKPPTAVRPPARTGGDTGKIWKNRYT